MAQHSSIHDLATDFGRRLDGDGPVGVAVSGGGDSVALLLTLARWGRRPLHVFSVDHGIHPLSAGWTDSVARQASAFGAGFTALRWQGGKPATGLAAAARAARHQLLAEAARAAGVGVLCLGHTRDDVAEAALMRDQGSNVGAPQAWGPSPAWPEGRGVFLYRPFLNVRRHTLRQALRDNAIAWIDDPANDAPQSLRARVRQTLPAELAELPETPPLLTPAEAADVLDQAWLGHGMITFRADAFHALAPGQAAKLLALAAVCAGGGDRLPRGDSLDRLLRHLPSGETFTLSGARIRQDGGLIRVARDAGDIRRRGQGGAAVQPGGEAVWDGRFAVAGCATGHIVPAAGLGRQLGDDDRRALLRLPADVRPSQPVWTDGETHVLLANAALRQTLYNEAPVTCWVGPRFAAAAGLYVRESDLVLPPDGVRL